MAELVNPSEIEQIVGARRHATDHIGRAISSQETVYILHSEECRDSGIDLRECPFSLALDRGIQHWFPWTGWRRVQNQAVRLEIVHDYLMPDVIRDHNEHLDPYDPDHTYTRDEYGEDE